MPGFDLKQISRNDQGILGAGILFFIFSIFAPFYGYSGPTFHGFGSFSVSAWHSYGFLGVLLILIAVGIVAARVFGNVSLPALPVAPNLLVAGLAALGFLILLLRGVSYPSGHDVGFLWGAWLLFILAIVIIAFAFLNSKAAGEKVAWDATKMPKGASGGAVVPPAAPYPPGGAAPSYPPADSSYPPAAPSYPPAEPPAQ
jgi:hypothetical protein